MKSKKGVELAFNTIIIAALVLTVFVVLVIVFTGGFGDVISRLNIFKTQITNKADCVIIGEDSVNDKDGDGYHDTLKYDHKCKLANGKTKDVKCMCDKDSGDKSIHEDDTCCK